MKGAVLVDGARPVVRVRDFRTRGRWRLRRMLQGPDAVDAADGRAAPESGGVAGFSALRGGRTLPGHVIAGAECAASRERTGCRDLTRNRRGLVDELADGFGELHGSELLHVMPRLDPYRT